MDCRGLSLKALLGLVLTFGTLTSATVLATSFVACGDTGGGDTTGGDDDDDDDDNGFKPEGFCEQAADCTPFDLSKLDYWLCDQNQCKCRSNLACGDAVLCNAFTGQCDPDLKGCRTDDQCPSGQFCDTASNQCSSRLGLCARCSVLADGTPNNEQCGTATDNCIIYDPVTSLAFCGKACQGNADCNTKELVGEANANCTGDRCPYTCDKNQCVPTRYSCCESDKDCSKGAKCDATTRQCVPFCSSDADCDGDQKCCGSTCVAKDYCAAGCGCGTGELCVESRNKCVATCKASSECPLGTVCDTGDGQCKPGCTGNSDCPPTSTCVSGLCQAGGCQSNDACPLQGQVCNVGTGKCGKPSIEYCELSCAGSIFNPGGCSNPTAVCLLFDSSNPFSESFCAVECDPAVASSCPKGFFCGGYGSAGGGIDGYACFPTGSDCQPIL